jgi:hypothetical protein
MYYDQSVGKSVIYLQRGSQFINRFRKFKVYLNDRYVCDISNGEEIILPVEEGKYELYLKIDWKKSETYKLSIHTDEEIHLLCGSPLMGVKLFIPFILVPLFVKRQLFIKEINRKNNI